MIIIMKSKEMTLYQSMDVFVKYITSNYTNKQLIPLKYDYVIDIITYVYIP